MILNLGELTARMLLIGIDMLVPSLLKAIKAERDPRVKHELVGLLQHMGVVKHRLEANLWLPDPFPGPAAWGYPMHKRDRLSK
ncbi:MAG: hypothetical protein IPN11_14335 [Opitutaceae bacterium]|nr:hypothetical protein [Opitutaceae bacterium]